MRGKRINSPSPNPLPQGGEGFFNRGNAPRNDTGTFGEARPSPDDRVPREGGDPDPYLQIGSGPLGSY